MNKITWLAGLAAVAALLGAGCQSSVGTSLNYGKNNPPPAETSTAAQGKVIFSVTDAAANMQGVTSLALTVDKIEMHSEANGWVTVPGDTKTFDLLALKASAVAKLAAEANVAAGSYDQIRLHMQKIVVVKNGVESEAKLPSNELKLNGVFKVEANATASVKLDFITDQSLHLTGSGKFIFTPVVKLESRSNAEAQVGSDDSVTVSGGEVDSDATVGMDLKGEEKSDFKVDEDSKLEVNEQGEIEVKSESGTSSVHLNNGLKVKGGVEY